MRNDIKIYYNNSSWILPDQIKSITVTDETDITKMTAPTLVVDITLKCEQDNDLKFELDKPCDVYNGNSILFEMYVSKSERGADFEWKLSLCGALGRIDKMKFYGGIYSAPEDYTSLGFYTEGKYYIPTITTIKGIIDEIQEVTNTSVECDGNVFPEINETLHQVWMPICSARNALLYINMILGGYICDNGRKATFKKFGVEKKHIPQSRILNDANITKVEAEHIRLHSYKYNMLKAGTVFLITSSFKDGSGYTQTTGYEGFNCNLFDIPDPPKNGPKKYYSGGNETKIQTKKASDNRIIEFDEPLSSYDMSASSWHSHAVGTVHPNYADVNEEIEDPYAVKYKADDCVIDIQINSNSITVSDIENHLVSPDAAEKIKARIKEDFGYNRLAEINVIEGYEKVKYGQVEYGLAEYASLIAHNITNIGVKFKKTIYGQSKYGTVRYRGKGQGSINVGDKVEFEVRGKKIAGFVTRTKYNLNGNIIIKNCEVVYREDEIE